MCIYISQLLSINAIIAMGQVTLDLNRQTGAHLDYQIDHHEDAGDLFVLP